ncbi:MAG: signal peptidase II [Firmicutes bacterium]|nr:signal peptidase II [Bacillota bacterium]MBQ3964826.1 signal peptidase II [Bacillota bacterium]
MYLYILIIIGAVALDQLVKYLVVQGMALGESIPVIEGIFHITRFHNTGAAFSSFEGQRVLLIAMPCVLIAAGLIYMWRHKEGSRLLLVPIAMIIGGGIGNLIDRALLGYVVDMFDFRVFPIFNVADSFVTVGCILLCIYVLISPDSRKKEG